VADVNALDVNGQENQGRQWPYLVRAIQYLNTKTNGIINAGIPPQEVLIDSGVLTVDPSDSTLVVVRPESSFGDELTHISTAGFTDGAIITLVSTDTGSELIQITDAAGGSGQINLFGTDFVFLTGTFILMLRYSELQDAWIEMIKTGYSSGTFGVSSPWSSAGLRLLRDANGFTHLVGQFTATLSSVTSSAIGTLPTGYRLAGSTTLRRPVYALVGAAKETNWISIVPATGVITWERATAVGSSVTVVVDIVDLVIPSISA
jgi:hypothetical protein